MNSLSEIRLLPFTEHPLKARYHGPHDIIKRIGEVNYVVKTRSTQLCHINMLKSYYDRNGSENVNSVGCYINVTITK